jgi:ATP-dependent HslUV protease ATP-binding subunit HslU
MASFNMTPKDIVSHLDRFIVGQGDAKKAVAIALRNRWRRMRTPEELRDEIIPKNILMIGPTGVGKTEISRRLAKMADAPFVKVEATKFTEVGYVGRDVEQIIRDLVEVSIQHVKIRMKETHKEKGKIFAEEKILDALVGEHASHETRMKFKERLEKNELDEKNITIHVNDNPQSSMPTFDIPGMPGAQMGMLSLGDMFGKSFGKSKKSKTVCVKEAWDLLIHDHCDELLDQEELIRNAITDAEQNGIVFVDEIDKICARHDQRGGEVSREGVQRDLLPLIEGTTVNTKHGPVKTDHILFITSGAFHLSKPSDLLPELQGRLPIRVELRPLTQEDFVRILKETDANLLKQHEAMMATEGVTLVFEEEAINHIAKLATDMNERIENIGARRLHTILEKVTEEISFQACEKDGDTFTISKDYVEKILKDISNNIELSKFIL